MKQNSKFGPFILGFIFAAIVIIGGNYLYHNYYKKDTKTIEFKGTGDTLGVEGKIELKETEPTVE